MKKLILLLTFGLVLSCSNIQHPDFAVNVESAKKLLELQGTEADLQAQLDLIHEDLQWQQHLIIKRKLQLKVRVF